MSYITHKKTSLKFSIAAKQRYAPWHGNSHDSYDTIVKTFQIEETLCKHLGMSHGHPAFIT